LQNYIEERKSHKKRLVQSPNSYFMDVKCPNSCLLTGGKARLTEEMLLREKYSLADEIPGDFSSLCANHFQKIKLKFASEGMA
uniref:Uncharacterized protein n=1 Tax=Leptobrachium leishanense TaxID=445787 RepID=A0A8C5QUW2_9ANUR